MGEQQIFYSTDSTGLLMAQAAFAAREATPFHHLSAMISKSIVDEHFSTREVSQIVQALAKISPQARGGRA